MGKKNFFWIGSSIGSFLAIVIPSIAIIPLPLPESAPEWLFELLANAISYLFGFSVGGLIGYFIKRR